MYFCDALRRCDANPVFRVFGRVANVVCVGRARTLCDANELAGSLARGLYELDVDADLAEVRHQPAELSGKTAGALGPGTLGPDLLGGLSLETLDEVIDREKRRDS